MCFLNTVGSGARISILLSCGVGALHGLSRVWYAGDSVPQDLREHLQGAAVAIWTTTGWTIPANQAVAVNERLQYAVVEAQACSPCPCTPCCWTMSTLRLT